MMEKSRTNPVSTAPARRSENLPLWILLALGLLLMLLAIGAARAEETESRTERFNATLQPGSTVRVENVSGDISATPGPEFRAVVEISVSAPTRQRAKELLEKVQIVQSRDGAEFSLETRWPNARYRRSWTGRRFTATRCYDCKIVARYQLLLPPGVAARLETVNGQVRVRDLDGDLKLRSVNGNVEALGGRRSLDLQTVNGKLHATAAVLAPSASVNLQTVNGAVLLTLPKDSRFELSASTMNGTIASTFLLPVLGSEKEVQEIPRAKAREPRPPKEPRPPRRVIVRSDGDEVTVLDLRDFEKELEESLREMEIEVQEAARETERALRQIKILDPNRVYHGKIGEGGARVRLTSLNGSVTLLASGTREVDAKPLVPERRSFVVTVPRIKVPVPKIRVHVPKRIIRIDPDVDIDVDVDVDADPDPDPDEVVRGDVTGDFLSTRGGGDFRIGRVSGRVKILSHSGEIRVASAGVGADLKTFGGDIEIGPVTGDLRAQTGAGDIRAGPVAGSLFAETSGGDIRIKEIGGGAEARTGGGDIVLPGVRGHILAETAGGDVRVGALSQTLKGGVSIHTSGGDVTLTLPADFRGEVELVAHSGRFDEDIIRSEFPELTISRERHRQRASGSLNGGGAKVVVRTDSGSIRLRKGPAAGQ